MVVNARLFKMSDLTFFLRPLAKELLSALALEKGRQSHLSQDGLASANDASPSWPGQRDLGPFNAYCTVTRRSCGPCFA